MSERQEPYAVRKTYEQGVRDAVRIVEECWQRGGASYLSYAGREIIARLLPGVKR